MFPLQELREEARGRGDHSQTDPTYGPPLSSVAPLNPITSLNLSRPRVAPEYRKRVYHGG